MALFHPLSDILVVSVEQALSAPLATCRLADAGARVVKIERPEGDFARYYDHAALGNASYFVWANRGKESVRLDFDTPEGRKELEGWIATADVFVQNLAPGALARRGLGSKALRERHPRLITCDISGYGPEGPFSDKKAYDNLIQAEAGLLDVTGTPHQRAKVGISVADISAGMHAYGAVLEALLNREKTGEGAGIHISMFDALADWMMVPWLHARYGTGTPPRAGTDHAAIAPYGVFKSADGHELMIGLQNEREWRRFCEIVLANAISPDDPRYADNALRVSNRVELDEVVRSVTESLPSESLIGRLDQARIAWARVNTVADLTRHPHLRTSTVRTATGDVDIASRVARFDGFDEAANYDLP